MTTPRPLSSRFSLARAKGIAVALIAALAACGGEGPAGVAERAKPSAHARSALSAQAGCADVTVHDKHANRFPCTACHPAGGGFGFTTPYTFPKGTTTAGGTLVRGVAPTPTTCSVGCHHPNAPANEIAWNAPGPLACTSCHAASALPAAHPAVADGATRADCERCHDTSAHATTGTVALVRHAPAWGDPNATAGFHAPEANRGLADCQGCHGKDLAGSSVARGCGACHDQTTPSFVSWKVRCTMCHGGTDDATGAPPKATWANGDDPVRTGAHGAHVRASAIAPAFDCGACHVKPQDALATAHLDPGPAEVTFGGPALVGGATPAWDRAGATCATTYCHGATLAGGSNTTPTWTKLGSGEAACGTCHGLPPPAPHPSVSADRTTCKDCHDVTMDAAGDVIPPSAGGKHLDGVVQSGGHPAAWKDPASAGFHASAANRGLGSCQPCHGAALDGVSAPVTKGACAGCHGAAWSTNCTMCHGGVAGDTTGAPPKATWGNANDPVRTGAHGAHVNASATAPAFDCAICHPKPADAFASGHLDGGTAEVTFGGIAILGAAPTWDRAGATCAATYCHGTAAKGGTNPSPVWTRVGQGEAACGACHGLPPPAPHPAVSSDRAGCKACHDKTVDASGALILASQGGKHLDGTVQAGSHPPEWSDPASAGFHANAANRGLEGCTGCHGATLDGGMGRACSSCHGATWKTACTMCHGGVDNQTGAPPKATWGKGAEAVRVGAHTRHVAGSLSNPIGCVACHPQPADALSAGHVDAQEFADVAITGVGAQGVAPVWTRSSASCVTYCHGATLPATPTNRAPAVWTGGPGQAACGTCHAIAPATGAHGHYPVDAQCQDCHPGYSGTSVNRAAHVNGKVETGGAMTSYSNRVCTSVCHSGTRYWY